MSQNRYINLVKVSQEIIKESGLPLRSSIFSKKKFNQHQLLSLIILKEELGIDYRDWWQGRSGTDRQWIPGQALVDTTVTALFGDSD